MFITVDTLRAHKACEHGIKYIERFYPNGARMIDIIRDKHISKEMLHWGRENLTHDAEELAAYCEACRITNSGGFWYSQDVNESKNVVKSKEVDFSTGVFYSSDILHSSDVAHSDIVSNARQIFYSSMVDASVKVFKGENVSNSYNICNSKTIAHSKNVMHSENIFRSSEIVNSTNITDSHFCHGCNNLKHCLFCYNIEDAEYYIFNQPVDKERFDMFMQQYDKYLTCVLEFVREWPENMLIDQSALPTEKFDDWYHPISQKFWKWAKTLPGYSPMLMYCITMLPEILDI